VQFSTWVDVYMKDFLGGLDKRGNDEYDSVFTDMGRLDDFCDFCGKSAEKLNRCSRCKIARYDSRKCQRKAWKEHKAM
jgi:hypothetical protein